MSVYRLDIVDVDLNGGNVFRSFVNKAVGEGDEYGNRFGFRLFRGKDVVSLSGCTVTGYFIRPDDTTVILPGNIENGGIGYVKLIDTCYAVEGDFKLSIKVTAANVTSTIRIVDGTIVDTVLGKIVDPGGTVPDINALMAVIERAEDAADAISGFIIDEELISGDDYRLIVDDGGD